MIRRLPVTVYVALGSNVGDRQAIIIQALTQLDAIVGITVERTSPLYQSPPMGFEAQSHFLNAVAKLSSWLTPDALLIQCQAIERALGRCRYTEIKWGPRTLDIDILFFGSQLIHKPHLMIPHPRLAQREFVLRPLCDIAPHWVHPALGQSVETLLASFLAVQESRIVTKHHALERDKSDDEKPYAGVALKMAKA